VTFAGNGFVTQETKAAYTVAWLDREIVEDMVKATPLAVGGDAVAVWNT
jgi:hypothetical protein